MNRLSVGVLLASLSFSAPVVPAASEPNNRIASARSFDNPLSGLAREPNSWLASRSSERLLPPGDGNGTAAERVPVLDDSGNPSWGSGRLLRPGDLNEDGAPDLLLVRSGATLADVEVAGRPPSILPELAFVEARDGQTGTLLWGPMSFRAGFLVSSDVWVRAGLALNGDGVPDVAVFEVDFGASIGTLYAFSGRDGSTIWTKTDVGVGTGFADASVAFPLGTAADFNGDGITDFLMGKRTRGYAPLALIKAQYTRSFHYVVTLAIERISGADGQAIGLPLAALGGGMAPDALPVGDVTGDGRTDVVVSNAFVGEPLNVAEVSLHSAGEQRVWTKTYTGAHVGGDVGVELHVVEGAGPARFVLTFLGSSGWNFGPATILGLTASGAFVFRAFDPIAFAAFCLCGDVDGDGAEDLRTVRFKVEGSEGKWITQTFAGAGNQITRWTHVHESFEWYGYDYNPIFIDAGDLDADGIRDQIGGIGACCWRAAYSVVSGAGYSLWNKYGDTSVSFKGGHIVPVGAGFGGSAGDDVASWRLDNTNHLVLTIHDGPSGQTVWSYVGHVSALTGVPLSIVAQDVTNDGAEDLIFAQTEPSNGEYRTRIVVLDGVTHGLIWSV